MTRNKTLSKVNEFQNQSKHKNFIFSSGIDCVYELFNLENNLNSSLLNKSINFIGNNEVVNAFIKKFADNGIGICWDQWFPEAARLMA